MNTDVQITVGLNFLRWLKCNISYQLHMKSYFNAESFPEPDQSLLEFVSKRDLIGSVSGTVREDLMGAALRKDKAQYEYDCMFSLSNHYLTDGCGVSGYQMEINADTHQNSKIMNLGLGFIEYRRAEKAFLEKTALLVKTDTNEESLGANDSSDNTPPLSDRIQAMHRAGSYQKKVYQSLISNAYDLLGISGLGDDEIKDHADKWF